MKAFIGMVFGMVAGWVVGYMTVITRVAIIFREDPPDGPWEELGQSLGEAYAYNVAPVAPDTIMFTIIGGVVGLVAGLIVQAKANRSAASDSQAMPDDGGESGQAAVEALRASRSKGTRRYSVKVLMDPFTKEVDAVGPVHASNQVRSAVIHGISAGIIKLRVSAIVLDEDVERSAAASRQTDG